MDVAAGDAELRRERVEQAGLAGVAAGPGRADREGPEAVGHAAPEGEGVRGDHLVGLGDKRGCRQVRTGLLAGQLG